MQLETHHVRAVEAALRVRGFTSFADARSRVVATLYDSAQERWAAWYLDMLASAIEAWRAEDYRVALRSFFLACEYRGRLGGFSPDHTNDAHLALSIAIVDRFAA